MGLIKGSISQVQNMNVLLLRQKENNNDKYHKQFKDPLIKNVTSIPVLNFEYYNRDSLKGFVENIHQYSGLIFTSRRAVTAFEQNIKEEQLLEIRRKDDFNVYVVGRSTENCLNLLGLSSKGAETGNAKELSELIIKEEKDASKPLMFLCGNLARETIPTRLTQANIPNESISCYQTVPDQSFRKHLIHYLHEKTPDIIVFFSPSGAEFHMNTIKELIPDLPGSVKIVCIGDYTATCVSKLDVIVRGVAANPTPESLFEVVKIL